MVRKKTKLYPSQIRYLDKNPIVSFHLKKEEKEKLEKMVTQSGKTVSQFVRECITKNIEKESKSYDTGYDRGYEEGRKKGYRKGMSDWKIWYLCARCDKRLYIKPNQEIHQVIKQYLEQQGWAHEACP